MKIYLDAGKKSGGEDKVKNLINYLEYPQKLRAMIHTTNVLRAF